VLELGYLEHLLFDVLELVELGLEGLGLEVVLLHFGAINNIDLRLVIVAKE